jgi:hypothetical protein
VISASSADIARAGSVARSRLIPAAAFATAATGSFPGLLGGSHARSAPSHALSKSTSSGGVASTRCRLKNRLNPRYASTARAPTTTARFGLPNRK